MSFGNVCDLIFSVAVMVYVFSSYRHIRLLKEQNRQLAELLSRTMDASNVLKSAAHDFRNGNEHSEEERRSATKDGNQKGNSGPDQAS